MLSSFADLLCCAPCTAHPAAPRPSGERSGSPATPLLRNPISHEELPASRALARVSPAVVGLCASAPARAGDGTDARAMEHAPAVHGGSLPVLADWWRQLDDPLLVELIDAAEAASPTVASAGARIAEARATRVAAGAALLPKLDGNAVGEPRQFADQRLRRHGSTGSGSGLTSIPPITTLQAGLQSSWEIDLFGGLRAGRDAAQARLEGAEAQLARRARLGRGRDRQRLPRPARLRAPARGGHVRRASRAETARLTDLSTRAGFTAPADAALARASAAEASARLTQQRAQCALRRQGAGRADRHRRAARCGAKLAAAPVDVALPAVAGRRQRAGRGAGAAARRVRGRARRRRGQRRRRRGAGAALSAPDAARLDRRGCSSAPAASRDDAGHLDASARSR